jgi:tRNA pseudouridine38-40 synthase
VPTYSLTLEYDGTDFAGWQIQPSIRTAMGVFSDALQTVTRETPVLTAAGRTDAGAHSRGQVVGCTLDRSWDHDDLRNALNATLPEDVAVVSVDHQAPNFDARRDAVERTYRYLIVCRDGRAPVTRRNAWTVRGPLDIDAMRAAAAHLVGKHDFAAFGSSPRVGGHTVRSVSAVTIDRHDLAADSASGPQSPRLETVVISVQADAFLRGMMRSFTGALVKIGQGRATPAWLASLVDNATERNHAVTVAPARGLYQWAVRYAEPELEIEEYAA